ncbi:MAG TPA: P-loop NTPase fold protein, partial [Lentzea sp.]
LGTEQRQLVVFIDDLDRCSPRTTAEVFEAINSFLSESFPTIRFVLGIDAAATAAHLDAAYSALTAADAGRDAADPSPGWTFLRKLVQLPLPLPRIAPTRVEPLLTGLLGTVRTTAVSRPPPVPPVLEDGSPHTGESRPPSVRRVIRPRATEVAVLEHDEWVRQRLAERMRAQPDLSVREAKRILTVWMFYVRVLDRMRPESGRAAVDRARHLVLLAEIVARWPASQRCLHRRVDGVHGLRALAGAVEDDVEWRVEVQRFGLTGDRHRSFRDGVRTILREYDGEEIAGLAELLT